MTAHLAAPRTPVPAGVFDRARRARAGGLLPRRAAPASARSSRSTPPRSAPPSAAPASTPTPPSRTPSTTCSTSPAGWPTRPRSPVWTSAAARPSSSATRPGSRPRRCCAPTAASWSRCTAATTPPATSAPTARTWTTSPASARYVTGRTVAHGGAGDSSVLTAYGVFQGMRAAAEAHLGRADAARPHGRRRRRRQGRPAPGPAPPRGRRARSWSPTWTPPPSRRCARSTPRSAPSPTPTRWSPPSSTSTPPARSVARSPTRSSRALSARIVCGAANNQLAHHGHREALADRGMLYAPDYVVNAGGLIQVADELQGFSFERARQRADEDLRHHPRGVRARRRRGRAAGRGRRPDRRAADGRGRPAARASGSADRRHRAPGLTGHEDRRRSRRRSDPGRCDRAACGQSRLRGVGVVRPLVVLVGASSSAARRSSGDRSPWSSWASAPKSVS